jgi:hypothetical protein
MSQFGRANQEQVAIHNRIDFHLKQKNTPNPVRQQLATTLSGTEH